MKYKKIFFVAIFFSKAFATFSEDVLKSETDELNSRSVHEFRERTESKFKKKAKTITWLACGVGCAVSSLLFWNWPSTLEEVENSWKVKAGFAVINGLKKFGLYKDELEHITAENKNKLIGSIRFSCKSLSLINGILSTICLYKGLKSLYNIYVNDRGGGHYENY